MNRDCLGTAVQGLKGGYQTLAAYLDPKTANEPVKQEAGKTEPPR